MDFFYLKDWHNNFLHYNFSDNRIIAIDDLIDTYEYTPVVITNNQFGILKDHNFYEFFYNEQDNTFLLEDSFCLKKIISKCTIYDGINDCFIKFGSKFLMATPQKEVLFCSNKARTWEFFYKIKKRKSNWEYVLNKNSISIVNKKQKNNSLEKNIFMFWDANEVPDIVACSINSIIINNPDYNFYFINFSNLHEYIDLEISLLKSIKIQHAADIIRFALLYKYGGFWIDSSLLIVKSLDDIINSIKNVNRYDLVAFYRDLWSNNFERPHIEIWFLYSAKGNDLCKMIYTKFYEVIQKNTKEAYLEEIRSHKNSKNMIQTLPNVDYFFANIIYQSIIEKYPNNFNFYLWRAEDSGMYLHTRYPLLETRISLLCSVDRFDIKIPDIVFFKLTSVDRKLIDHLHKNKINHKGSLISNFLNKYKSDG